MNVGVICEGVSDYPAITSFVSFSLKERGIEASFRPLYPEMDQSRRDGGWSNVLLWLLNNPPQFRVQTYFTGGLFGGGLQTKNLDAIIIQIDSDVIEDKSFRKFVKSKFDLRCEVSNRPDSRADFLRKVLRHAAQFDEMSNSDKSRHVLAPSVESTETWCLAAFVPRAKGWEALRGDQLTNEFMSVLEKSEGREVKENYINIDKDYHRRRKFCEKHASGAERIFSSCKQYETMIGDLIKANSL